MIALLTTKKWARIFPGMHVSFFLNVLKFTMFQEHHFAHITSQTSHYLSLGKYYHYPFVQPRGCWGFPVHTLGSTGKSGRLTRAGAITLPSPVCPGFQPGNLLTSKKMIEPLWFRIY